MLMDPSDPLRLLGNDEFPPVNGRQVNPYYVPGLSPVTNAAFAVIQILSDNLDGTMSG